MRTNLKTIAKLLPPPKKPRGLDRTWEAIEQDIGLALPEDYKAFIDLYGTGQVTSADGWVVIWNFRDAAFFKPSISETLAGPGSHSAIYRQLNNTEFPCPYPIYPDPEGLLPFGTMGDVQSLNWLTIGAPNKWDVVYFFSDGLKFTRLDGDSFNRCMLKMLRKEYTGMQRPSEMEPPFKFTEEFRG